MKHAKRVATAAAIVTSGLFAGTAAANTLIRAAAAIAVAAASGVVVATASAAPPLSYDQEAVAKFDAAELV